MKLSARRSTQLSLRARSAPALQALALAGLAALALGAQAPARAATNIVNDGGFEQTNFSDAGGGSYDNNNGTLTGPPGTDYAVFDTGNTLGDGWSVTQGRVTIDDANDHLEVPHGGTFAAYLDYGARQLNTLTQTLATTPGQSYLISYFLADNGGNPVTVDFGGQQLFSGPGPTNYPGPGGSAGDYVSYSYTATATGADTALSFTGETTNLYGNYGTMLDDVSVTPLSASPAPEPSQLGMLAVLGAGLTGLIVRARRRQKAG